MLIKYKGKEIELEQLPSGKWKIPDVVKQSEGLYSYNPKPAVEVVVVCQKPMNKDTFVEQYLDNGRGVVDFDSCRIPYKDENTPSVKAHDLADDSFVYAHGATDWTGSEKGRFPANLLVSDDVLDEHSRFFSLDSWAQQHLPFLVVAKAAKKEKNAGLENLLFVEAITCKEENTEQDILQEKDILELITKWSTELFGNNTLEKSQMDMNFTTKIETNKTIISVILNSKHTLNIKDYILDAIRMKKVNGGSHAESVEDTKEWKQIIMKDLREYLLGANPAVSKMQLKINVNAGAFHPTIKPIKLLTYLITMGSRPDDVVLDPFMGSGSTGCAAALLRRNFIGVELDPEYVKIAEARIEHWKKQASQDKLF